MIASHLSNTTSLRLRWEGSAAPEGRKKQDSLIQDERLELGELADETPLAGWAHGLEPIEPQVSKVGHLDQALAVRDVAAVLQV